MLNKNVKGMLKKRKEIRRIYYQEKKKKNEKGNKEINVERTEDALETQSEIIATGCPFCNTMMTDGIKNKEKEGEVKVIDIAELIANAMDL